MTEEGYSDAPFWNYAHRSSYVVMQRRVCLSMPYEWQKKMIELLEEVPDVLDLSEGSVVAKHRVNALGFDGRFISDPLADYRHTGPLPRKEMR